MNPRAAHERYEYKPFIGSSHLWAIEKAMQFPRETRVLDMGAGSGMMGKILKDAGFKEVHAVEIDPAAAAYIAPFYSRVVATIDEYPENSFDLILMLDVIEHLPNAEDQLARFASLLAPGGSMLISVPNVAHWSVRFSLLVGQFNYQERGILDRTHVSFFTRRRVRELIAGIRDARIVDLSSSIEPVELVLPGWVWNNPVFRAVSRLRLMAAQWLPGLMAYQHLAIVQKAN